MANGLRILITNLVMNGRTGTEIVTRNLAAGLLRRGHAPTVYSPEPGEIAAELRRLGVPVVSTIDAVREAPDVIHGHHAVQAGIAAARFPDTPALFVCHDYVAWHDSPPRLPSFVRYVAVGDATFDRLTIVERLPPACVRIIENGVDIERFRPGASPPPVPRRAIVFAKSGEEVEPVARACGMRGIALEVAGKAVGRTIAAPEDVLPGFDLVFASGMTAIEALACLRPVVVCDGRGLAGFVDTIRYPAWRRGNFGLRTLVQPLAADRIAAEIDRYDAAESIAVGKRIRREAHLDAWISRYEALHAECIADFAARGLEARASPAQVALHMESWSSPASAAWERERSLLRGQVAALQAGLLPLAEGERTPATDVRRVALRGFHSPEPWGVWSSRPNCSAIFRCAFPSGALAARIEYEPFLAPARPRLEVTCRVNGEVVDTWVDAGPRGPRSRVVALGARHDDPGAVFLSFSTSAPVSPASAGQGFDDRALGIGLVAITLIPDGAAG